MDRYGQHNDSEQTLVNNSQQPASNNGDSDGSQRGGHHRPRPLYTPSTSTSSIPQFYGGNIHQPPPSSTTGDSQHTPSSSHSPPFENTEGPYHHDDGDDDDEYNPLSQHEDVIDAPTPPPAPVPRSFHHEQVSPADVRSNVITHDGFSQPFDLSGASTGYDPHAGNDATTPILGASLFTNPNNAPAIQILRSPSDASNHAQRGAAFGEGITSIALANIGAANAGPGFAGTNVPPPRPLPTFDKDYNVVRKPSLAKRLMGGLGRMRTSAKRLSQDPDYAKIHEEEEEGDFQVPGDISSFHPDFTPAASSHNVSQSGLAPPTGSRHGRRGSNDEDDSRYLGKGGAAFDLSDDISLYSRKTGFNTEIIIPHDPNPPNWKPHELRLPYLTFLNLTNLALLGSMEYLIQLSDNLGVKGLIEFTNPQQLSLFTYFCWKYLPTLVGVIYGILWELTDTEVKRVEPYYQMTKPRGAVAKNSLNIEYFSFWSFLAPVQAFRFAQWPVVLSSTCYVFAYAIVPNLLSVVLNVDYDPSDSLQVRKYLVMDPRYSRPLEAIFALISILSLLLTYNLWRRKTGLVGDVSGIAGIAAMANKSHILQDFQDLDEASAKKIHYHLSRRRYRLHKMSLYLGEKVDKKEQDMFKEPRWLMFFAKYRDNNNPPLLTKELGIPFMVLLSLLLIAMEVVAHAKGAFVVLQKFPFFAIGPGILIKSIWEVLDKELRILQPFYDLFKGNAPPQTLTLDYTATIPFIIVVKALKRKHWLLAWVTFMTAMIEVLTVAMGAFLNRSKLQEETPKSLLVSEILAVMIMIGLIITQGVVIWLRRVVFLPRQPGTIASVLTFIHQSKMVTDFQDMEFWSTKKREEKLVSLGKTYGFGWFTGRDKRVHLGIDEEPMRGKYRHGADYRAGVVDTFEDYERF